MTSWGIVDDSLLKAAAGSCEPAAADETSTRDVLMRAADCRRKGDWSAALMHYSQWLHSSAGSSSAASSSLADAYYGRALCQAELGRHARALLDLSQCIASGPEDEQLTEDNTSFVPLAVVAKFALLSAFPELSKAAGMLDRLLLNRTCAGTILLPLSQWAVRPLLRGEGCHHMPAHVILSNNL